MFKTHLKFFSRVFLKDKFFSLLNISGLSLGIAVSILLLLILQNDLSYDKHHVHHKRIYRLSGHLQATGLDERLARVARELGPVLKEEFPQYRADEIQNTLLSGLSGICIFISLLGLLGLSAFTATQRTKEIGIRKVHGATIPHIIFLLYRDVMLLIVVAAILIVPIALYLIRGWMENFAYRAPLNYALFGFVAVLALVFGFLTVVFHSLKTARTNPVDSLKYE